MRLLYILIVTLTALSNAKKRRPEREKKISPREGKVPNKAHLYPEKLYPVPFGHIFKEGFQPHLKQPVDLLELDRIYPKDHDQIRETVNKEPRVSPQGFASPKDSFYFGKKEPPDQEKEVETDDKGGNKSKTWLDLVGNHAFNLAMTRHRNPAHVTPQTFKDSNLTPPENTDYRIKEQFLSSPSYGSKPKETKYKSYNWTTCDEFGHNADFHPSDVINIDWVPFYTWSLDSFKPVAFVHRFESPTVKMVKKYKENLGPYLNKTLDWDRPKLYLKSDVEMLLVAVDRKGEFQGIPYNELPDSMKMSKPILPSVNLRLKIVDPYLAMMYCEYHYATIMAVSGNEPNTLRAMRSEAATLKFKGKGHVVARDLEAERLALIYERESKIQSEKDKFILAEDQVDTGFPFER